MSARILLIRLKSLGDVLLTLPAVHAVRANFPDARITYLTSIENAALLRGFREVDEVVPLDRPALRSGNPFRILLEVFRLLRRLRSGGFSLVVDFQGFGETAWLAWITGAPQRWGSVYSRGRKWAYTRGIPRDNKLQIADWNLALLEQCNLRINETRNQFSLPPDALAAARAFLAEHDLNSTAPTLFIQALTSSPHKNWPMMDFLALAEHFRARGKQVVFACGPHEVEALLPAREAGFPVAAGLPLLTVAGLETLSTVIVGGATGLLHLAVALGKRVVMLIGHPKLEPGFPYQHRNWAVIPQAGEGMDKIKPDRVITACAQAFQEQEACNV